MGNSIKSARLREKQEFCEWFPEIEDRHHLEGKEDLQLHAELLSCGYSANPRSSASRIHLTTPRLSTVALPPVTLNKG